MKLAIAALLAGSAAAFTPVAQKASSATLNMAFESEIGAQPPLGFFVSEINSRFSILSVFSVDHSSS